MAPAAAAAGGGEEKEAEGFQGLEGEANADSLVLMVTAGDRGWLPEGSSVDACGMWLTTMAIKLRTCTTLWMERDKLGG